MKEFDDLCAKDLREKCQKNSDEATSNDDNENNVENSMDVDNNDTLDDPTNKEKSAQVNSKKPASRRKKYNKNKEGRYICDHCDATYSQTHNLIKHIKNLHGTKVTAL